MPRYDDMHNFDARIREYEINMLESYRHAGIVDESRCQSCGRLLPVELTGQDVAFGDCPKCASRPAQTP